MRAAIYSRVSTETQEKQETIKSQLDALREYANKNNYFIYEEYSDEGYSGELLDRPALDKLRDDAKKKLFDFVLCHSPDRLSRKFLYQCLVQDEFKKYGVNIVFLNRPDTKDTPEDNLLIGMQGLIAEYEKAKILERTRRGKIHKAKRNLLVGSIPPYGFRYIKGNEATNNIGHYEVKDKEAEVVKLIFDLFANKYLSLRAIAKDLTRRKIPPRKGKYWRTSTLHTIIRNETYIGVTYYNKHVSVETDNHKNVNKYRKTKNTGRLLRPKEHWIPITLPDNLKIIDKETFDLAQKQLKRNSELSPRNVKYQYLLRGLVRCGKCDAPFYGFPCHGNLFYRCGNRHRTFPLPKECNASMVKAEDLEGVVWNKICEAIKNPRLLMEQVDRLKDKATKSNESIIKDIESIDRELIDIGNEENRLLDAYRENVISKEQLKDQMAKVQNKRSQLEQQKQALVVKHETSVPPILIKRSITDFCKLVKKRLDSLKDDFDGKRYLLSLAINKIVLEGKTVRIKGIIPSDAQKRPLLSNIAYTPLAHCGHQKQLPRVPSSHAPDL